MNTNIEAIENETDLETLLAIDGTPDLSVSIYLRDGHWEGSAHCEGGWIATVTGPNLAALWDHLAAAVFEAADPDR